MKMNGPHIPSKRKLALERHKRKAYQDWNTLLKYLPIIRIILLVLATNLLVMLLFHTEPHTLVGTLPGMSPHTLDVAIYIANFLAVLLWFVIDLASGHMGKQMRRYYEVELPQRIERLEKIEARYDQTRAACLEMGIEPSQKAVWSVIRARHVPASPEGEQYSLGLTLPEHGTVYLFAEGISDQQATEITQKIEAGKLTFSDLVEKYDWKPVTIHQQDREE
jgi:hypothetical protein